MRYFHNDVSYGSNENQHTKVCDNYIIILDIHKYSNTASQEFQIIILKLRIWIDVFFVEFLSKEDFKYCLA